MPGREVSNPVEQGHLEALSRRIGALEAQMSVLAAALAELRRLLEVQGKLGR